MAAITDVSALLDKVITDHLELNPADSYVSTQWRPRILHDAQIITFLVLGDGTVYNFMLASGSVTLAAGVGDLPANFGKFPPRESGAGAVYVTGQAREVKPRGPVLIQRMAKLSPSVGGLPDYYSVYGRNTATKRQQIITYPQDNSGLDLYYQKKIPTLVDATSADGLSDQVPDEWYEVWYIGVCDILSAGGAAPNSLGDMSQRFQVAHGAMKRACQVGQEGESDNRVGDRGANEYGMW